VLFSPSTDRYQLSNASGLLKNPMTHSDYVVDLRAQSGFEQLDIFSADFQSSQSVTFDELGAPDNGGSVTVRGGTQTYRIDVAPVTGTVNVVLVGS